MKNIFKFIAVALFATTFTSCEDEQDLMFVNPVGSFEIVSPESGSTVVITAETVNNIALTVTWQDMDYTTPTAVNYVLQVAADEAFTTPVDASSVTTTTATLTAAALNTIAINAGIEPGVAGMLYVRVKSTVGTQGAMEMYSNVITCMVTPFQAFTPLRDLFLVGSAAPTGWDNAAATNMYALYRDPANEDVYYYTGYFAAGEFKMVEVKGQWAPQYGSDNAGNILPRPTESEPDPSAFTVATAGYYSLMADLSNNTYTFESFDAASAPAYTTMGIIGTSTPGQWESDTDMAQTASNPHIWYKTGQALTDGEMKFREGDAWTNSWGNTTPISGVSTNGGPNIPVTAGTYDIWFNDLDGRYILIPAN